VLSYLSPYREIDFISRFNKFRRGKYPARFAMSIN
jgi:hypothetical protein